VNIILFDPGELDGCRAALPARDPRAAHLLKTLRKGPGDFFDAGVLLAGDGPAPPIAGRRGRGRIDAASGGILAVTLALDEEAPERLPVTVGVGFCRPIELRRIFRDLSSMGAAAIAVFGTASGEKSYRDTNLFSSGGARAALVEGAVQSRDTTLPRLSVHPALAAWLAALGPATPGQRRIAADNVRPQGCFGVLAPGPAVLAIGSERGWTDAEREELEAAGFARLALGTRALRTETAAAAAVARCL